MMMITFCFQPLWSCILPWCYIISNFCF